LASAAKSFKVVTAAAADDLTRAPAKTLPLIAILATGLKAPIKTTAAIGPSTTVPRPTAVGTMFLGLPLIIVIVAPPFNKHEWLRVIPFKPLLI
jgi:hypothetical protein